MAKEKTDFFEGREMRTLEPHLVSRDPAPEVVQGTVPVRGRDSAFAVPEHRDVTRDARTAEDKEVPSRFLPLQGLADPAFAGKDAPGHLHVNQPYGSPMNRLDPETGAITPIPPKPDDIALASDVS